MRTLLRIGILLFAGLSLGAAPTELDLALIDRAASNASSLFLDATQRVQSIRTFLTLTQIKGSSGREQLIREAVKRLLAASGAVEIPLKAAGSNVPLNLIMELPATGALTNAPGLLLNAHLDTIAQSTPENIVFDPASGDFQHRFQTETNRNSSFGGDDRSGVAVIVQAMRVLQGQYWKSGLPHRRIVLVFTADEERGCVGAKYLSRHQPELFANLEITLSMDGPLDLRSNYPEEALMAVVSDQNSTVLPYQHALALLQGFCDRAKLRYGRTVVGLGMGDFAHFPATARAGLHLRSPVRGWHNQERVNMRDLINHIDLICFLMLGWDDSLPPRISPDTLLPRPTPGRK